MRNNKINLVPLETEVGLPPGSVRFRGEYDPTQLKEANQNTMHCGSEVCFCYKLETISIQAGKLDVNFYWIKMTHSQTWCDQEVDALTEI